MYVCIYMYVMLYYVFAHAQMYIRKQIQAIDNDSSLDESERARRKQVYTGMCLFVLFCMK